MLFVHVLAALLVGFLTSRLVWMLLRTTFSAALFTRENYRGHALPTAVGLVLIVSALVVEGMRSVLNATGWPKNRLPLAGSRSLVLVAALGYGLLGFLDDLAATRDDGSGFRGHARSLASGRFTTGTIKLLGGGFLALVLAGPAGRFGGRSPGGAAVLWLVVDAAVIALSANLANLFDRAPGRVSKVALVAFALLVLVAVVSGWSDEGSGLVGPAVVIGASVGLMLDDLRERLMLGDTGANVLGAVLGVAAVNQVSTGSRAALLVVLLALNGLSEIVSFSRIIDGVAVFRAIDRAGTLPIRESTRTRPARDASPDPRSTGRRQDRPDAVRRVGGRPEGRSSNGRTRRPRR